MPFVVDDVIPEAEFNTWLTPREALERLAGLGDRYTTADQINQRLCRGLIRAAAKLAISEYRNNAERIQYARIKPGIWAFGEPSDDHPFWRTAKIEITTGKYDPTTIELFGVRFDPAGIHEIAVDAGIAERPKNPRVAVVQLEEPQPEPGRERGPQANRGGRPPKEFWEDLLIEIFDQLWHGSLVPKVQADIESAMSDWISANNHEASERSIRQRAQKLWKVWIKEGNN